MALPRLEFLSFREIPRGGNEVQFQGGKWSLLNPDPKVTPNDAPTTEHFQIWAAGPCGGHQLSLDHINLTFTGFIMAPDRRIEFRNNNQGIYGAFMAEFFEVSGNNGENIYLDTRVMPFPPKPLPGTYHVKYMRKLPVAPTS